MIFMDMNGVRGEVHLGTGEFQLSRNSLERLSTEELVRMGDHYGVDIPLDLERMFVIEQLLELAEDEDDTEDGAVQAPSLEDADFPDQASLPRQYNISFMEVLVRDPLWAFVFWELRSAEKEVLEAEPDFGGYYLKVTSKTRSQGGKTSEVSFSVSVGNDDTAWYLGFPPEGSPDGGNRETGGVSHQVELCSQKEGVENVLVSSAAFRLPVLAPKKFDEQKENQRIPGGDDSLAFLSGFSELQILRNGDRQSRMKTRKGSATE